MPKRPRKRLGVATKNVATFYWYINSLKVKNWNFTLFFAISLSDLGSMLLSDIGRRDGLMRHI
jgi:hypothetical protein